MNAADERGTLKGRILNAETREALGFANVILFRITPEQPDGVPAGGAMGTAEGTYEVQVEPGSYRVLFTYVSYETYELRVTVEPGKTVVADGLLPEAAISVQKVTVTAKAIETSGASMRAKLRTEGAVNDAITSDEISKTTDKNAAEALQRVTGVSVVDGKYVYVRGLGERYSSTSVNGTQVGTPEPNKRVVPLDLFPSGVLDNIVVQKTYTPDLPGEFAGAQINVNTKDFVEGTSFKQTLSLGYSAAGANPYQGYQGGSLDWLGFDDGTRAIPDAVRAISVPGIPISKFTVETADLVGAATSFSNVWTPANQSQNPNFSYSGVFSGGTRLFGKRAGLLLSASLGNNFDSSARIQRFYEATSEPRFLYDVSESERTVLGGLTGNFTQGLREKDKLKVNLLYTRNSEDRVLVTTGPNYNRGTDAYTQNILSYVERGLFSGTLQGEHHIFLKSEMKWAVGYSQAERNEPDRRRTVFEIEPSGAVGLGAGSQYPFTRVFGESDETARTQRLDWTIPLLDRDSASATKFKLGYHHNTLDRSSSYRRFGFKIRAYCIRGECIDPNDPAETLLSEDNLRGRYFEMEETTRGNDAYSADRESDAAYGMLDFPLLRTFRVVTGVRYEKSLQNVEAGSPWINEPTVSYIKQGDEEWLPSVNVTWRPNRKHNVRAAYSRTLNRPELRELSPFDIINYETGWSESGSPGLETATIRNYDLRWEHYPLPGEFISFGLFRKDFDRPIQRLLTPDVTGYRTTPSNAASGLIQGFETEARVSILSVYRLFDWMVDLGGSDGSMSYLNWGLVLNYSQVDSRSVFEGGGTLPFIGQSDYSFNAGIYYNKKRWDSSLLLKKFGPRMDQFGLGVLPNIFEFPRTDLDFTLAYRASHSTRIKLAAKNLLDQRTEYWQGDLLTQAYESGRSISIGVTYAPENSN